MGEFDEFGRAEKSGWSEPETVNAYVSEFAQATEQCVPYLVRACGGACRRPCA